MPAAPRILILFAALLTAGCAHLQNGSTDETIEVLKAQLAQQQSQIASQKSLLTAILGEQSTTARQQQRGFANLQDQMEGLRSVTNRHLASRNTTDDGDT